jgi:signal transduction histidine kinase
MVSSINPHGYQAYQKMLGLYRDSGGETELTGAYDRGRRNLNYGTGLRELAKLHQKASAEALSRSDRLTDRQTAISGAADCFLQETSPPYEVTGLANQHVHDALIKLYDVFENEAKHIAHRLHDESAQMLAVVYLELAEIAKSSPEPTARRIRCVVGHLDVVCEQLRSLSHELRPLILDQVGLMPALKMLIDGVRKRNSVVIDLSGDIGKRLEPALETTIYRAVQEALANVCRHANASHADVHVWSEHDSICCAVSDNGDGFDQATKNPVTASGLGLIGIQERVKALGGYFEISSHPGNGTTLQVTIPL